MLYGTDLTSAYADGFEQLPAAAAAPAANAVPSATEILMQREMEQRKSSPPSPAASQQQPLRPSLAVPPPQYIAAPAPQYIVTTAPRPSYWDQLRATRRDMSKLLVLALAVAVGLAVHHACKQYIKYALATRDMTMSQETAAHACYPMVLLFLLWNVKALLSAR